MSLNPRPTLQETGIQLIPLESAVCVQRWAHREIAEKANKRRKCCTKIQHLRPHERSTGITQGTSSTRRAMKHGLQPQFIQSSQPSNTATIPPQSGQLISCSPPSVSILKSRAPDIAARSVPLALVSPNQSHDNALNANVAVFDNNWIECLVGRLQSNRIPISIELLQCCALVVE